MATPSSASVPPPARHSLLYDHAKSLAYAIKHDDAKNALVAWDHVNAGMVTWLRECMAVQSAPVTALHPPPIPSTPAPSVLTLATHATNTTRKTTGTSGTKRSFIRRALDVRFIRGPAWCSECLTAHPFNHWASSRNSISFNCATAGVTARNQAQARFYRVLLARPEIQKLSHIDFTKLGEVIRDAVERDVHDPIVRRIDPSKPWSIDNVRIV